ncbi:putative ribosome biogenesis GTPase RsgA [Cellvibrio zantedeschiae]|uniref:Small ribosomal subunit biogenesis GTPase RsgA n=1 Tax=Cellvibrio zantedeschiae TaxID=1237077 RepID=A0ABQ3B325_9GAMM|nr:ribosome small subunit-dependent GTPase A [Cellvibrio zantedeschiae]GGY75229.1 putative ribosome biogenesis GTPase RsgA [Cellvibrio zantedeschiae]
MINIDFESLRPIGLTPYIAQQLLMMESCGQNAVAARVIEIHRDRIVLHNGNIEFYARILPNADVEKLAVGDWVIVEQHPNNEFWICDRMQPVTQITRRTQDGNRQLLVSNVDTAILVMGLDNDFNLRRMERYLAIVQAAQVTPIIVLTKQDIVVDAEEKLAQITQRLPPHLTIYSVNALEQKTSGVLAPWLSAGQTLVLLGSSGAGKSTLTNGLTNSLQETGAVRVGDSRGRHTTRSRSLHCCTSGACIIDTPGLRSWSPDADEDALDIAFDDISSLALNCKFRNCQHNDEPGCAVRGAIDDDRLHNYQKLLREIKRSQQTALERIEERAKWKVLHKAAEVRTREKRKEY